MKIEEYEAAAEAILFAMGDSVEIKKLAFALQVNEREAEMILRNLADRYQADNCGLQDPGTGRCLSDLYKAVSV